MSAVSVSQQPGLEVIRGDVRALPYVMATERIEGYEELVGRRTQERHREALGDGRHALVVGTAM
jgi:hypothetical protein